MDEGVGEDGVLSESTNSNMTLVDIGDGVVDRSWGADITAAGTEDHAIVEACGAESTTCDIDGGGAGAGSEEVNLALKELVIRSIVGIGDVVVTHRSVGTTTVDMVEDTNSCCRVTVDADVGVAIDQTCRDRDEAINRDAEGLVVLLRSIEGFTVEIDESVLRCNNIVECHRSAIGVTVFATGVATIGLVSLLAAAAAEDIAFERAEALVTIAADAAAVDGDGGGVVDVAIVTTAKDIAGDVVVIVDSVIVNNDIGVGDVGVAGPVVAIGDADTGTAAASAKDTAIEGVGVGRIGAVTIFDRSGIDTDAATGHFDPSAAFSACGVLVAHRAIVTHGSQ